MRSRTDGFEINPEISRLSGTYPECQDVLAAIQGERERGVFARLWLSEGVPYAFSDCPALYEESRGWLAAWLDVHPKQISIVGSVRLGYSLSPDKLGRDHNKRSDLDYFAVSPDLFAKLEAEFLQWRRDYANGNVEPMVEGDDRYWPANRDETPKNISRGFLDTKRVPNYPQYRTFQRVNRRLEDLAAKLRNTSVGPNPDPCRIQYLRCYKDWQSYEQQQTRSLAATATARRGPRGP